MPPFRHNKKKCPILPRRVKWGCEKQRTHYTRESGFFIANLEKVYRPDRNWHTTGEAAVLAAQYQFALESALNNFPEFNRCLVFCHDCGIQFFRDPRALHYPLHRCPFGCAREHTRHESNKRSGEYYKTKAGKEKKKVLNANRNRQKKQKQAGDTNVCPPLVAPPKSTSTIIKPPNWKPGLLRYIAMLLSNLERRKLSIAEIRQLLNEKWRQRHMVGSKNMLYRAYAWKERTPQRE